MSFGISAAGWAAIVAAVGTSYSVYSGERNASMQRDAQAQAKAAALKQEKSADEANNRANQKSPDTGALLSAAQQAGKNGASGTMLTGSLGIDPGALSLGKTTLLGG